MNTATVWDKKVLLWFSAGAGNVEGGRTCLPALIPWLEQNGLVNPKNFNLSSRCRPSLESIVPSFEEAFNSLRTCAQKRFSVNRSPMIEIPWRQFRLAHCKKLGGDLPVVSEMVVERFKKQLQRFVISPLDIR